MKESLTLEKINEKLTKFRERLEAGERLSQSEKEEMARLITKGLEFVREETSNAAQERIEELNKDFETEDEDDDEEDDDDEEAVISIKVTKKGFSTEINGFSLPEVLGHLELIKQAIIKEHN